MTRRRALAVLLLLTGLLAACTPPGPGERPAADATTRRQVNALRDLADHGRRAGDDEAARGFSRAADDLECRAFGCRPAQGATTVAMDPGGPDFLSMPWPDDTRRRSDGSIDLTGFPGRAVSPAAEANLAKGEAATFGFGIDTAVYLQTTAAVDPAALPGPDASTGPRSATMLLDLDHPGAPPVPLLVDHKAAGTRLRPANLLALLPYPGHALRPRTRYAAVAFSGLTDTTGLRLAPAPLLGALDGPAPAGAAPARWDTLRAERDAAVRAVRQDTLWHPSELVAFSVFTTQDTTADLDAITRAVAARPAPTARALTPALAPCTGGLSTFTGQLDLPRWQQGTPPYLDGGGVRTGPDGRAESPGTETVELSVTVPCGEPPEGGWPFLLWMDGTGAGAVSRSISQLGPEPLPYAVLSVAPVFSGDRFVTSVLPGDLLFFNYLNPVAGRANQLQQAADLLWLRRLTETIELHPTGDGPAVALDRSTVVAAGHSQGAVTLPLTLAADPTIRAGFISSGGAGLFHSMVHRGDVQRLIGSLLPAEPGELDLFHPLFAVLQTFADGGDASAHADRITRPDLVLYAGLQDGCSPIETSVHLATALGLPVTRPLTRRPLFGSARLETPEVEPPVSRNLPGGRTGVLVELDDGHFGASHVPAIGRSFVASIAAGGPTVVDPGPPAAPAAPPTGCPRADPAPRP